MSEPPTQPLDRPVPTRPSESTPLRVGDGPLSLEQVDAVVRGGVPLALSSQPAWLKRIQDNHRFFTETLAREGMIYGVTTGFGNSCTVTVSDALIEELPRQLTRFHGCGLGDVFDPEASLAILVARVLSLAHGYSGVRLELLETLVALINQRILPVIPQEGSVGASGDLTPLSYVAAVLLGERDVFENGQRVPAKEALARAGIPPLALQPKESLALMNGTAVMTALCAQAWTRAEYLMRLCTRITAMSVVVLKGNRSHFAPELFAAKPHPGQAKVAAAIHRALKPEGFAEEIDHIQDRYSLRCAPHVLGVLADALPWMRDQIETELNSANDNPIVDHEAGRIFHGGHFYGGHMAFVADSLKNAVANIADLLDRQIALMVDPAMNHGLPPNLSGASEARRPINHGFKALQIGSSAWTAEALKLTMPASVFSRSTECHNQDKVSMGTIAARDAVRVLELTEQVTASAMLVAAQGVELRRRQGEVRSLHLSPELTSLCDQIAGVFPFLEEDRPLEETLRTVCQGIRNRSWNC